VLRCVARTDCFEGVLYFQNVISQTSIKANSHVPFRVVLLKIQIVSFSFWNTARPFLIYTYHAVPLPCSDHAALKATSQGHGMGMACCVWTNMAVSRRPVGDPPRFGFFRLWRELSRRTWHCRRTAGARHGMCELVRHGMAGTRHGMCELVRHGMAGTRHGMCELALTVQSCSFPLPRR
jgi:hypothetical protein